ncbi:MAG: GAF domain-containing protein [Chloroflexi bacterium]|nr:GAF domain-containing protein [Chloroflexota bacterium]
MLRGFTDRLESMYDGESLRRARAIGVVMATLVPILLIPFMLAVLISGSPNQFLAAGIGAAIGLVFLIVTGSALTRGNIDSAAWLLILGYLTIGMTIGIMTGVDSPAIVGVVLLIALGALFLSGPELLILTGVQAVAILLLGLLQLLGMTMITPDDPSELIQISGASIVFVILAGGTLSVLSRELSRATRQVEERSRNLEAIIRINDTITSATKVIDMLDQVATQIRREFEGEVVTIYVVDGSGDDLELRAVSGESEVVKQQRARIPIAGSGIYEDVLYMTRSKTEKLERNLIQAVLPLVSGQEAVGVMQIEAKEDIEAYLPLLQTLANQIGLTLKTNAADPLQQARAQAAGPIFDVLQRIGQAQETQAILDILSDHLVADFDVIVLMRIDRDDQGSLTDEETLTWDREGAEVNPPPPALLIDLVRDGSLMIPDIDATTGQYHALENYAVQLKARSLAAFALISRDTTIGYVLLGNRLARKFSAQETNTLATIANAVALTLDNIKLESNVTMQSQRLGLVSELAYGVSDTLDMEMLGNLLREQLSNQVSFTHMSVATRDGGKQSVVLTTFSGSPLPERASLKEMWLDSAIRQGKQVNVVSTAEQPLATLWTDAGIQSLMIVPLMVRGQVFGGLILGAEQQDAFSAENLNLTTQVANQVAPVLDNIRLVDQLQQSLEETQTMYSTAMAMNAAQSLAEVYDTVLQEIQLLSGSDRILLFLAGPDPRGEIQYVELVAIHEDDHTSTDTGSLRYPLSEAPVLSQFPQSRSNMLFNNVQNDPRLDETVRLTYDEQQVQSLMMIPLATGNTWLGAVLVEGKQGQSFNTDQLRMCRSVSDQAALAVDSQLLLQRSQLIASYEGALRSIVERIRSVNDVETLLEVAATGLSETLGRTVTQEDLLDAERFTAGLVSSHERELIRSVAHQVNLAIENLSLFEGTRRLASREQKVSRITADLQRTNSVDEVMEITVRSLADLLADYDITVKLTSSDSNGDQ